MLLWSNKAHNREIYASTLTNQPSLSLTLLVAVYTFFCGFFSPAIFFCFLSALHYIFSITLINSMHYEKNLNK